MNSTFFYILITISALGLAGCAMNRVYKKNRLEALSNQAFFQYIYKGSTRRLPIYIDSVMGHRMSFLPNKMYGFKSALSSPFLLDSISEISCKVIIPDSFSNRFQYCISPNNIACDSSVYYFVSPLMPTKVKNTFLMQVFLFSTVEEDKIVDRFRYQYLAEFKVKGKSIIGFKVIDSGYMGIFSMGFMQKECECGFPFD